MIGPREKRIHFLPPRCLQTMWQSVAILIIAVLIGLSANSFRHARLPLVADWSLRAQLSSAPEGDSLLIAFEEAEVLFLDQGAIFIDARPVEAFRMGHIEGARNLPWEDFELRFSEVMSDLPLDSIIITYCDGASCNLSKELASALLAKGYDRVRVLLDGWRLWQQFNLPTEP
jgi:rhodanese-related sulfurtransferase